MRAVDTNVLARYYLRDDPGQGRIAESVLAAGDVFVPKTVILELEWVLRYVADRTESKVLQCIEHLIALPGVTVEDRDAIETALGILPVRSRPCRCTAPRSASRVQRTADDVRRSRVRAPGNPAAPEAAGASASRLTATFVQSLLRRHCTLAGQPREREISAVTRASPPRRERDETL